MADASGLAAAHSAAEQPVPPLTQRRPRVREVSSRFMSPSIYQPNATPIPTPNTSDLPRLKSVHRRLLPKTDENHIPESTDRGMDKSSASILSTLQRKQHQQRVKQLLKENGESKDHPRASSRPDTPIAIGTDRIVPSRYRQAPNSIARSTLLNSSSNGLAAVTAAARLLQEATAEVEKKLPRISTSSRDDMDCGRSTSSNQGTSSCPNSPLCMPSTKLRNVSDTRSSMPDVDKWLAEKNLSNASKSANDCARSLVFSSSAKMGGGIALPPHPSSYIRSGLDAKKGRKTSSQQEDLHSLRMLQNHYLQWRIANAKAEASIHVQKQEAERKFYSIGSQISDLRDNVKKKRYELAVLTRIKILALIIEAQMPHLDEWASLEEDFSASLSSITESLLSSSVRLPVSGEVRADVREINEALSSALKVAETIGTSIQEFVTKAEDMDTSVSELAKLAGGERALIEECGDALCKAHTSQVKECSLRGTLMQLVSTAQH